MALFVLGMTGFVAVTGRASVLATECVIRDERVMVRWQAPCDMTLAGFRLERLDQPAGHFVPVIPDLIESSEELVAATWYEAQDRAAVFGQTNTYRLTEVHTDGRRVQGAPFGLTPREEVARPMALSASGPVTDIPVRRVQAIPGDRVKLFTERTGVHGVSAEELAANLDGFTTNDVVQRIATSGFRLTCGTNEIAWTPAADNTGLLFYAEATDSIYTRQNVYWIEPLSGVTMNEYVPPAPGAAVDGLIVRDDLHVEKDVSANQTIFSDPEADIWFWVRMIVNTSRTTVTNCSMFLPWAQAGAGTLRVELKGSSPEPLIPLHHARIFLNGVLLGAMHWNGYSPCIVTFPATNWVAGTNSVTVEGYSEAGESDGATFYIDSFDAAYDKLAKASGDVLLCSAGSNALMTVSGFTMSDITVYDVTDPLRPVRLTGAGVVIDSPGAGEWRVTFVPQSPMRRYWVMAGASWAPIRVTGRPAARWSTADHQAEHLVVYHESLRAGAESLVAYRCAHGLVSLAVDVEDLYDEFSKGLVTPHAIRSFLTYAQANWIRAPDMVVLAGAGNWDYRNARNITSDPCLIPPVMVDTPDGLVGVDMPLGDTDGDHIPDVVIGRLSVLTSNQMADALHKIEAIEAAATNVAAISMVTDANDPGLGVERGDFAANSGHLASYVSSPYTLDYNFGATASNMTQVRERFVAELNEPRTMLTYMGHANDSWLGLGAGVLSSNQLSRLTNDVPPVFLAMTCLFGRSTHPYSSGDGFAEQLVRKSTGGLAAVWSCAAQSDSADNTLLGSWMMRACFRKNGIRLGRAMKEAMVGYSREAAYHPWVLTTYSLIGDPGMDLGLLNGEPATYEEWQQAVFTTGEQADPLVSDPDADPDYDGFSNQQEYLAGTLPKELNSRLSLTTMPYSGAGGYSIRWASASNRLYAVEWSTNLLTGFQTRVDHIWAVPPENLFTDPLESGGAPVFYRVQLMDSL